MYVLRHIESGASPGNANIVTAHLAAGIEDTPEISPHRAGNLDDFVGGRIKIHPAAGGGRNRQGADIDRWEMEGIVPPTHIRVEIQVSAGTGELLLPAWRFSSTAASSDHDRERCQNKASKPSNTCRLSASFEEISHDCIDHAAERCFLSVLLICMRLIGHHIDMSMLEIYGDTSRRTASQTPSSNECHFSHGDKWFFRIMQQPQLFRGQSFRKRPAISGKCHVLDRGHGGEPTSLHSGKSVDLTRALSYIMANNAKDDW